MESWFEPTGCKKFMKKIISLFQRNYEGDYLVRDEVVPGAEWVLAGEGMATRKFDGTSCLVQGGKLYRRYDAKHGKQPPDGFLPAQDPDPKTGHWPGWIAVGEGSQDQWHREAWANDTTINFKLLDGTYELIGPKVGGNPEQTSQHTLIPHGVMRYPNFPRDFKGIKAALGVLTIEGIVWHHPDGRMVKIKTCDFGLPWAGKTKR